MTAETPANQDNHRLLVLIPVYNHAKTLPSVVSAVRALGLPCLLVDDGSDLECAALIERLALQKGIWRMRLAKNSGKGAAVAAGLLRAAALGYSHALQIDADGQHDLSALEGFIAASRANPSDLIGGAPQYASDAPKSRLYGRWVMRIWVWINSLSLQIPDAMCGFRIYPLASTLAVLKSARLAKRMAFDPEILVRLVWQRVPMRWLPLAVQYPQDGVSHFRLWQDNALISLMHTRLFFGMLLRAPLLLWQRWQARRQDERDSHWAEQSERGNLFWMRLGFAIVRRCGRPVSAPLVWLVVLYFYLSKASARRAIADYQQRLLLANHANPPTLPRFAPVYRQYLAFAATMLDKFDVLCGKITRDDLQLHDPDGVQAQMGQGRGQILLTAHLGNAQLLCALAAELPGTAMNILIHSQHAQRFNQLLGAAAANLKLIEVSTLDATLMLDLAQRLDKGEWLVMAGDRVPLSTERSVKVQFLGAPALLPQGPWLMAALLRCPLNLLLCLRSDGTADRRFSVILQRLPGNPDVPRSERAAQIAMQAQHYADCLAQHCRQRPLQWFNFYPFWEDAHA